MSDSEESLHLRRRRRRDTSSDRWEEPLNLPFPAGFVNPSFRLDLSFTLLSSSDSDDSSGSRSASPGRHPSEDGGSDSAEEGPSKDDHGPAISKEQLKALLKAARRVDDKEVTLTLNPAIIEMFKAELLGGGKWASKARRAMQEKYYLSKEQYADMEPPSLKNSPLYTAVENLDWGLGKTLLDIHQLFRATTGLALREYETFVAVKEQNVWSPVDVLDEVGHPFPEYAGCEPKDIEVDEPGDEDKINALVARMGQPGQAKALAREYIQNRRAARLCGERLKTVRDLYGGAKTVASTLSTMLDKTVTFHWDMLQYS